MNKKRLLKLADLLDADAKNKKGIKFDMSDWGEVGDPSAPVSCNTSACAMGLAGISGAFKRAGLGTNLYGSSISFTWKGGYIDGFAAAERLFGISEQQAEILFAPRGKINTGARAERAKAKQIRKFVRTGNL